MAQTRATETPTADLDLRVRNLVQFTLAHWIIRYSGWGREEDTHTCPRDSHIQGLLYALMVHTGGQHIMIEPDHSKHHSVLGFSGINVDEAEALFGKLAQVSVLSELSETYGSGDDVGVCLISDYDEYSDDPEVTGWAIAAHDQALGEEELRLTRECLEEVKKQGSEEISVAEALANHIVFAVDEEREPKGLCYALMLALETPLIAIHRDKERRGVELYTFDGGRWKVVNSRQRKGVSEFPCGAGFIQPA